VTGNAKNWYEYGNILVEAGQRSSAENAWASAVRLSPDKYGKLVGDKYEEPLRRTLQQGKTDEALSLGKRLLEYQPNKQQALTADLQKTGIKLLNGQNLDAARPYLTVATTLNPQLRTSTYQAYIAAGDKLPEEIGVFCYGDAIPYSDIRDQNIGKRVLEIGMKFAKIPGAELLTNKIRKVLRQYMGDVWVEHKFPEVEKVPPGIWDVSGQAGERSSSKFVAATYSTYRFHLVNDCYDFEVVYDDGEVRRMWIPTERDKGVEKSFVSYYLRFYGKGYCKVSLEYIAK